MLVLGALGDVFIRPQAIKEIVKSLESRDEAPAPLGTWSLGGQVSQRFI